MNLSNQALGAIMMALQESLLHQTDIVPVLQSFNIENTDQGLVVTNPPTVKVPNDLQTPEEDTETDNTNASL